MTPLPILYSFRRCPYAMRARLALLASGQQVELREVVLRDKPAEMIAASPKATVPVLVLPDGTVIDESLDIMEWALAKSDALGLLASDPDEQRTLVRQLDSDFKPYLDKYKYPDRPSSVSDPDPRGRGMLWIETHLAPRLTTSSNLFGERVSFADFGAFPFIRQFAHVDRDWFAEHAPKPVSAWLQRHLASARFEAVMPKYPQWVTGQDNMVTLNK